MKRVVYVVFGVLLTVTAGCGKGEQTQANQLGGDSGLTLLEKTSSFVRGRFAKDATSLSFEIRIDGDTRSATLRKADDELFVETRVVQGFETTSLFRGKLTWTENIEADEPQYQGDKTALTELQALPETALIGPLRAALAEAGVELNVIPRTPGRSALAYWLVPAQPGEVIVPTWSFWYPTYLLLRSNAPDRDPCNEVSADGCQGYIISATVGFHKIYWNNFGSWPEYGPRQRLETLYYWGAPARVRNLGPDPFVVYRDIQG